jgi:hypothetical protein
VSGDSGDSGDRYSTMVTVATVVHSVLFLVEAQCRKTSNTHQRNHIQNTPEGSRLTVVMVHSGDTGPLKKVVCKRLGNF